jgi:NADH-quinone oxidoreductase subunit G
MTNNTVTFTLDGREVTVPKGTTVYTAAKEMGIELPIFCYQDRMPPFGACRVCLVEVEKMPKLQTSCTLVATDGMVVNTQSERAVQGRENILELLLINHPLDCPICDRGGECPLQDQAQKYGPGESRFFEEKRRFKKPVSLGPVLMLDRERCVVCARCTRFGDIVAGDHALEFQERGFKTEVGTPGGGPAESKFIGNTIKICPVGALTSQVYRFRARPWDNDSADTACTLCPVGCSMILDSRDGEVMRTRSRENSAINDIWLCDKGWFGYEFSSSPERLQTPLIRRNGKLESADWEEALKLIADQMKKAKPGGRLAGWGGNPLSLEENFLFQKLMRTCAQVNHVDHRIGMPVFDLDDEGCPPGMQMPVGDCAKLPFVLLLGLDLTEEFPVVWLRLKEALNQGAEAVFIGHYAPEIAPHLTQTLLHPPGNELGMLQQMLPQLRKAGAIFVGRQYLASPQRKVILSEILKLKHPDQTLHIMEGKGNSFAARLAGMHPAIGPMDVRLSQPGLSAVQILEDQRPWDFLYVAGANCAVKYPSSLWNAFRSKLKFLVVQDLFLTETALCADVVLPTLSFVEKKGHFVTIAGDLQKLQPGKNIPEGVLSDADIFIRLGQLMNTDLRFDEELLAKPRFKPYALQSSRNPSDSFVPDEALMATFAPALFDHGVRMKHNSHLVQLAKEHKAFLHPHEGAKRGLKDGDVVLLSCEMRSIEACVGLDERVAEKTIVLPLGFEQIPVHELGANLLNGMQIEIQKIGK